MPEMILNHGHASDGELLHLLKWYGYIPDRDTCEPIRHLPWNLLISYYRLVQHPILSHIDEALV